MKLLLLFHLISVQKILFRELTTYYQKLWRNEMTPVKKNRLGTPHSIDENLNALHKAEKAILEQHCNVKIPEDIFFAIKEYSVEQHKSLQAVVIKILSDFVKQKLNKIEV